MRFSLKSNASQVAGVPVAEDPAGAPQDPEKADAERAERERNAILAKEHPETETETDDVSITAQAGVQKIEATTKVWSWGHLITAYILWVDFLLVAGGLADHR